MKAHELEGAPLALAVAQCVGDVSVHDTDPPYYYGPPLTWERCGPIIERERITLYAIGAYIDEYEGPLDVCKAAVRLSKIVDGKWRPTAEGYGPTPLIAAMRAYIAMMASVES